MPWTPDYITSSEFKSYTRITDTVDDAEIGFAISAASRAIDKYTGRQFGSLGTASPRYYSAVRHGGTTTVWIDDLQTASGLIVKVNNSYAGAYSQTLSLDTDFLLRDVNATADGLPWTKIIDLTGYIPLWESGVEVTALWGWTSVPAQVKQACLIQSLRLFKRKDAPFGIAGSPEMGSELRLLNKLDPDVQMLLDPLRRMWGGA